MCASISLSLSWLFLDWNVVFACFYLYSTKTWRVGGRGSDLLCHALKLRLLARRFEFTGRGWRGLPSNTGGMSMRYQTQ